MKISKSSTLLAAYLEDIQKYIQSYNDVSVSFTVTGAAASLALIGCISGGSKMLFDHIMPYDPDAAETFNMPDYKLHPAVDSAVAIGFVHAAKIRNNDRQDIKYVGITGALTTNRWRKGEDHAYVYIDDHKCTRVYHLKFSKLTEEEWNTLNDKGLIPNYRLWQDLMISDWVLQMIVYGYYVDTHRQKFPKYFGVDSSSVATVVAK